MGDIEECEDAIRMFLSGGKIIWYEKAVFQCIMMSEDVVLLHREN